MSTPLADLTALLEGPLLRVMDGCGPLASGASRHLWAVVSRGAEGRAEYARWRAGCVASFEGFEGGADDRLIASLYEAIVAAQGGHERDALAHLAAWAERVPALYRRPTEESPGGLDRRVSLLREVALRASVEAGAWEGADEELPAPGEALELAPWVSRVLGAIDAERSRWPAEALASIALLRLREQVVDRAAGGA